MNLQMFTLSEVLPSPPTKGKVVKGLEKLKGIAFNMISKYFFNNIFPFLLVMHIVYLDFMIGAITTASESDDIPILNC